MAWLLRNQKDQQAIFDTLAGLQEESDRSAAIVAGAVVEIGLTGALRAALHDDETIADKLFKQNGALGNFEPKIHLAYLVGNISQRVHRDLLTFKDIRNKFAHQLTVVDFKSQAVRDLCFNLKVFEDHVHELMDPSEPPRWSIGIRDRRLKLQDPRDRYLLAAQIFTLGLSRAPQGDKPRADF